MKELSLQNERMNKQVADIQAENKKLVEPLRQAQAESTELKRQLMNYEKDKLALAVNHFKQNNKRNWIIYFLHFTEHESKIK